MEVWKEVFVGVIPTNDYGCQILNGEVQGLVITLESAKHCVVLDFGMVLGVRMLYEGIVQEGYSEKEIQKYKAEQFKNVIYEIKGGMFEEEMREISEGYLDFFEKKHYVVITQNYNIDIITAFEPDIIVKEKSDVN